MDEMFVAVIDAESMRIVEAMETNQAITTLALVSEDPGSWREMLSCWPRYRTPIVAECMQDLGWQKVGSEELWDRLLVHSSWLIIDLLHKCIALAGTDGEFERDVTYKLTRHSDGAEFPVAVALPPWWRTQDYYVLEGDAREHGATAVSPQARRDVLFGPPLREGLAWRLLDAVYSPSWRRAQSTDDRGQRYRLTIDVHRDWLMTPLPGLAGRTPRECMHGAHDWLERLVHAQRRRHAAGLEMVALPAGICGGELSPISRDELILHFDLCRVMIDAGWEWCGQNVSAVPSFNQVRKRGILPLRQSHKRRRRKERRLLTEYLRQVEQRWLSESYEGGHCPRVIMEYSRRRVPRAYGLHVKGMEPSEMSQTQAHLDDCECPICDAMHQGLFGTAFELLDGYHLELDDEFAFSLCECKSEWQAQQAEFANWTLGQEAAAESPGITESGITESSVADPQLFDEGQ